MVKLFSLILIFMDSMRGPQRIPTHVKDALVAAGEGDGGGGGGGGGGSSLLF